MARSAVGTVLGTMEFGRGSCLGDIPKAMTDLFLGHNNSFRHLDTAYMYAGGDSEKIIGQMNSFKEKGTVATKINPWEGKNLGEESIRNQVSTCLERLSMPCVEIMYLHGPDHNTPLEDTLRTMDALHKEGKFKQLGLSNYSSWLVAEAVNICKKNNWVKPTVYQGMYSAITRQVEEELIPCLRYYGLAFYAYSPLGGGIMSGKYEYQQKADNTIEAGRFNGLAWDKVYRERYWKEEHFQAMDHLKELLKEHHKDEEVSIPEAAFRWIYHHSQLDGDKGDCVILGSSKLEQLEANLGFVEKGPLAKPVVKFFNEWWKSTKQYCPRYHR